MASTSNKNTPGDYAMEQAMNQSVVDYETYQGHIMTETTYLPGRGLTPARFPMQVATPDVWDIESELRGIGSTNLVTPKTTTLLPPQKSDMKTLNVIEGRSIILPRPIQIPNDARFTANM